MTEGKGIIMAMSTDERNELRQEINSLFATTRILISRVSALEEELQELRDAATSDDEPRSLASVIGESADYQRFMKTH